MLCAGNDRAAPEKISLPRWIILAEFYRDRRSGLTGKG